MAVAYVRPEKLVGMTPKSVRKKMKAKGFAAAVKREDIVRGAELMEAELNDHIAEVIAALQGASSELGFGWPTEENLGLRDSSMNSAKRIAHGRSGNIALSLHTSVAGF